MKWEKQPPIANGHTDVWKCGDGLCRATVRDREREAHDRAFHSDHSVLTEHLPAPFCSVCRLPAEFREGFGVVHTVDGRAVLSEEYHRDRTDAETPYYSTHVATLTSWSEQYDDLIQRQIDEIEPRRMDRMSQHSLEQGDER